MKARNRTYADVSVNIRAQLHELSARELFVQRSLSRMHQLAHLRNPMPGQTAALESFSEAQIYIQGFRRLQDDLDHRRRLGWHIKQSHPGYPETLPPVMEEHGDIETVSWMDILDRLTSGDVYLECLQ